MNIKVLAIGRTDDKQLQQLIDLYVKRLSHYVKFELEVIPELKKTKNRSEAQQKEKEGELILKKLTPTDVLILLDENGQQFTSVDFSRYFQKRMIAGIKTLVLVIGGPYGFSETSYAKPRGKISLSKISFSHQMVRLFVVKQITSAFNIYEY